MSQSNKRSIKEACVNLMIGYGTNWVGNLILLPWLWDGDHPVRSSTIMGVFFTIISFIRTYCIRRFMAKRDHIRG